MEMSQVRYVLAAARLLNFTRAAAEVNVSQPALTKGIKQLEAELGDTIFERAGKRIALTPFGARVMPHLQQIADGADLTRALASSHRLLRVDPVRLGVRSTIGPRRLTGFLTDFHARCPAIELAITEASIATLKEQLLADALDLAIMTDLGNLGEAFACRPLYEERYVVLAAPGDDLAQMDTVRLAGLSGRAYVDRLSCEFRETVMARCAADNITLYARFRSEREDWIQAMVQAGIGFAFMPECSITAPGLISRPLVEPQVTRQVCAVTLAERVTKAPAPLLAALQAYVWG